MAFRSVSMRGGDRTWGTQDSSVADVPRMRKGGGPPPSRAPFAPLAALLRASQPLLRPGDEGEDGAGGGGGADATTPASRFSDSSSSPIIISNPPSPSSITLRCSLSLKAFSSLFSSSSIAASSSFPVPATTSFAEERDMPLRAMTLRSIRFHLSRGVAFTFASCTSHKFRCSCALCLSFKYCSLLALGALIPFLAPPPPLPSLFAAAVPSSSSSSELWWW
mmetsp:Transcript_34065/g.69566  ORF Transcript_34065/g.69566 Transcript_34065/m.69566 type:complete len:221 (+) Transcript_34065:676-1338(+)